ncbi:ankyrin repeat domain-containing protein [Thermodesulfobacteriota bacterium]
MATSIAVISLVLLIWASVRVTGRFRRGSPVRLSHCLVVVFSLCALDGLLCIYFASWTGTRYPGGSDFLFVQCLVSFALIVVCPSAALLLYRYYESAKYEKRQPPGLARIALTVIGLVMAGGMVLLFLVAVPYIWPPLSHFSGSGNTELVKLFLRLGFDVNETNRYGRTPLMQAVERGRQSSARLLLDRGADVNFKGRDGWTALYFACSRNRSNLVKLLLARGADVNASTNHGWTPLMIACNHPEQVSLLIANGADVNARERYDKTVLMRAASMGLKDSVKLLLDHGADTGARDREGRTALMHVCAYGYYGKDCRGVAALLLERGADLQARDNKGKTASDWAERHRRPDLKAFLEEYADGP